jgi:hypothetical protein
MQLGTLSASYLLQESLCVSIHTHSEHFAQPLSLPPMRHGKGAVEKSKTRSRVAVKKEDTVSGRLLSSLFSRLSGAMQHSLFLSQKAGIEMLHEVAENSYGKKTWAVLRIGSFSSSAFAVINSSR